MELLASFSAFFFLTFVWLRAGHRRVEPEESERAA